MSLLRLIILTTALISPLPFSAYAEEASPYGVIKVEKVLNPEDITKESFTYYNINAGKEQGVKAGDFFKITRVIKERRNPDYSIFIGEVQVIESYENISKARVVHLADPAVYPAAQYRAVMLGDHATPMAPPVEETASMETPPPPAPSPPSVTAAPEKVVEKVAIAEKVLFDLNKAEIRSEAKEILKIIAEKIKGFEGRVSVEGHACDIGSEKNNLSLSKKRAEAVVNHLVSEENVPKEKLEAKGFGEKVPLNPGKAEEERAQNRRVEIMFIQGQ